MKSVCETLDVARSNIAAQVAAGARRKAGRKPAPEADLLDEIKAIIGEMPTYGYRRVWAILRRVAQAEGRSWPNHKRVYRVMKAHGLLLPKHASRGEGRAHDGKIAVDASNLRWCSDGFELACDNGEKVRVAFALDCCDREAISYVATTEGIKGEDVRDLMSIAVEARFGGVNRLPHVVEWLTDNGSCYVAGETRRFASDIGFEPRTTPVESPQSNGMAEAFVRTIKRDYARVSPAPDAKTVMSQLPKWFDHYNRLHPHKALGYRSPKEFIAARSNRETVSGF